MAKTNVESRLNMTSKVLFFIMGFGLGVIGMLLFSAQSTLIQRSMFFFNYSASSTMKNNLVTKLSHRRQFAIFAASIHSKIYSYVFYAPITAAAWQRIGYDVIFIFTGDFTQNSSSNLLSHVTLSRTLLQRLGVHILDVQCNTSYDVKLSQLVRMFGGFLPDTLVHDEDYIITADSDLLPLKQDEYKIRNGTHGFIFNAMCCGSFKRREKSYRMFPMGHICLRKNIWHNMILESIQRIELLNRTSSSSLFLSEQAPFSFETISLYVRQEFGSIFDQNMVKGDASWYMDQVLSSMMLADYRTRHPDIVIDERARTQSRLDPGFPSFKWEPDQLATYGDAHLIHDDIFSSQHWLPFTNMLKFLFNATLVEDFIAYYRQFVLILRDKPTREKN